MLILLALPGGKQMGNSVSLWQERGKREVKVEEEGENKTEKRKLTQRVAINGGTNCFKKELYA